MVKPFIKEAKKEFGIKTRSLTGDGAYGSGKMRKEMSNEGIKLISKAPVPKDTGKLSKEEFDVDLKKEKITCPEGKTTTRCYLRSLHHKRNYNWKKYTIFGQNFS